MTYSVSFGSDSLQFSLPESIGAEVIESRYPPPLPDPEAELLRSIREPIGSAPLSRLAEGRSSAVIVIPDGTRPLPLPPILAPLLRELTPAIPLSKITILFATGMHRPVGGEERLKLLGDAVDHTVHVVSHDPDDVRPIGESPMGIPVSLDRRYVDADLRIVVGLVEPHLLAGFSGGRKMIAPGIIGLNAMPTLHGPYLIGHPDSTAGKMAGNPFHEEIEAIAGMAGVHFAISGTIDDAHRLTGFFSGELIESHRAATEWYRERSLVRVERRWPVVVTCGGGAPLDATLYQSIKGVVAALALLEPGGTVVLAASCDEGWGSDSFVSLLEEFDRLESFLDWAQLPGSFRRDQWMAQHFLEAKEECRIVLCSTRKGGRRPGSFGIEVIDNLEEGIRSITRKKGAREIAILPRGPYTWVGAP